MHANHLTILIGSIFAAMIILSMIELGQIIFAKPRSINVCHQQADTKKDGAS